MDHYLYILLLFVIFSLFPVTPFMEILVFSHSFNKKLLNIVISDIVSINLHVYNLVFRIFIDDAFFQPDWAGTCWGR